jgi:hypothetical protein
VFFEIKSQRTGCPGWLWTAILLISASWVARITGVSHWHLVPQLFWCPVLLVFWALSTLKKPSPHLWA